MRRPTLERLARSRRAEHLLRSTPGLEELLDRFLAGEHPANAVVVGLDMVSKGLDVSFAQPQPTAQDEATAEATAEAHLEVVRLSSAAGLAHFEVSLSLPGLGSALGSDGPALALGHARRIVEAARAVGAEVTIDMGRAEQVDQVLEAMADLRSDHPDTGVALQAMLRRTARDAEDLAYPGSRVRLCKGAFPSGPEHSYQSRIEIDRHYVRVLRMLMESPAYPMVATHDARMVSITHELVRRNGRTRDDYEFQMLMGVRPFEHRRLVDTGRRLRVYIPYGRNWYPYLVHRVGDSPRALYLIGRQLLSRR